MYFEAAPPPIRRDFVWSEQERREGYQKVPGSPLGGALAGPPGSLPIAAFAPRQRSKRQTRSGLDQALITLPGLAVCWSSSYTRCETSRVHSPPRVMATGPDRHGAWRFGADVTSDGSNQLSNPPGVFVRGDTTVPRQTRSRTSSAARPADSHVLKFVSRAEQHARQAQLRPLHAGNQEIRLV